MSKSGMIRFAIWAMTWMLCTHTYAQNNVNLWNKLIWSDEFDGKGLPDSTKWGYDQGNGCPKNCGWGNNELQYYTVNDTLNARQADGMLIIEARSTGNKEMPYTSARLVTKDKASWPGGYVEARIKLPKGKGVWPAFWMLPQEWKYGGWPTSGEIDIMEFVGYTPDSIYGTLHCEDYNHINGTQVSKAMYLPDLADEFHVYGMYWDKTVMYFYLDGKPYLKFKNNRKGFTSWPFDQNFYAILNLAVGGNWGGKKGVDPNIWPQKMYVDYVRVYQLIKE